MNSDKPDEFNWPAAPQPPAALSDAIRRACTADLAPIQPRRASRGVVASIITSGVIFAVLLAVGWMRHPPRDAVIDALLGAVAWGLLQASVLFVGHGKPPGLRCNKSLRWAALLVVPTAFLIHLLVSTGSMLSLHDFLVAPRSLRSTISCGVHSLLFGALATVVLFVMWRRTDPYCPRLTGALTGLAGGMVGAVALDMVCANNEGWHLWLAHGLTLIAFVFAGWFAGKRWLTP
jgi:hypothetical protein